MASILKTSAFINNLYEIEKEDHEDEEEFIIEYNTFLNQQLSNSFNNYSNKNPSSRLTNQYITDYVNIFEQLNLHNNFEKPSLEEYFNKRLNFLLLMDFIISFDKNKKLQTPQHIFDFFLDLSHFYRFMSYLDVDAKFLEYIKYMLVLYLQSLNRATIDKYFHHISWELDEFFKFEVIRELHIIYDTNLRSKQSIKQSFEKVYKSELAKESSKIDYTTADYNYLDDYFQVTSCNDIVRKFTIIEVPYDVNESDDEDTDYNNYDPYGDDYYSATKKVRQYHIDCNDPLFKTNEEMFIYRTYQQTKKFLAEFEEILKTSEVRIKDFTKFEELPNKSEHYKNLVLVYVGEGLSDYGIINNKERSNIFKLAYDMCHIDIVRDILMQKDFRIEHSFRLKNDITYREINNVILSKFPNGTEIEESSVVYSFNMK